MDRKPTILRSNEILAQITASVVGTHHNSTFQKFSAMLKLKARRSQTGDTGLHKFKRYLKVTMYSCDKKDTDPYNISTMEIGSL